MKWRPTSCKKGDMLRVKLGIIYHYGIFISEDEVIQFGLPPIASNQTGEEVVVLATDIQTFCCGEIVEVAMPETPEEKKRFSVRKTVKLAKAAIGKGGYDRLHNNCEHFAYECVYGQHRSDQVDSLRRRFFGRPLLHIYLLSLQDADPSSSIFPPLRMQETERAQGVLKQQKIAAWQALGQGLAHSFDAKIEDLHFHQTPMGKWICDEYGISITHTDGYVAVAISNQAVGVDLENMHTFDRKYQQWSAASFAQKICTPQELQGDFPLDLTAFLRLWTRKESIYKRSGEGKFSPQQINASADDVRTVLLQLQETPLMLSVCSDKTYALSCYLLGKNGPCRLESKTI